MKYAKIQEEELKNKVAADFFAKFDCTEVIDKIDFSVRPKANTMFNSHFLWAEAKKGSVNITKMLTQLILTIGKARTFDKILPPPYLGAFDYGKIAFVPYHKIHDIFYQNDFNWNVTPSNHDTPEFRQVHERITETAETKTYIFDFVKDEKELRTFIKENFVELNPNTTKIRIDKNNFVNVYKKWHDEVKPSIGIFDWDKTKKSGLLDGDFYLADLLSRENATILEKLQVILKHTKYVMSRHVNEAGIFTSSEVEFNDKQKAHTQFWLKYERPPKEEYWDYIIDRRDLLVPQDVRERKGSFYTPQIWVELSQKYLADTFGEDWQDEYYIWDCAAGTGNLLAGLTNKYNIWASTLDETDVDVMRERIHNMGDGANLLKDHVFQFDFLNDSFEKLPEGLRKIIKDEPEKLIIYINPPYAEAANARATRGTGENRDGLSKSTTYEKYKPFIGNAINELFAQFLIRIYKEIERCKIANFATLKALCASNFGSFRKTFQAKLEMLFVCPADTFDNVSGKFPIGFHIWDTNNRMVFENITSDVYNDKGLFVGTKNICSHKSDKYIFNWLRKHYDKVGERIAYLRMLGTDMQNNKGVFMTIQPSENDIRECKITEITKNNLIPISIYYAVRKSIDPTWLNDRDQFLYPNDGWQSDREFQTDCLAYTLFHGSNNISSRHGVNHWIPFTEREVNSREKFDSHFMTDFIGGRVKPSEAQQTGLFETGGKSKPAPLVFSAQAAAVFDAGRELWRYYHSQKGVNPNASFYDIRAHFQGRKPDGKMNPRSNDDQYNALITALRDAQKLLAKKIEPKIYEYGFLRE